MLTVKRMKKSFILYVAIIVLFFSFGLSAKANTERVDDASNSITYGGAWANYSDGRDFKGTEKYSDTANDYAELRFYGNSIKWIGPKNNKYGIADVYVDGVLAQAGVDLYSPTMKHQQVLFSASGLSSQMHTIKVVVTGNKNAASTAAYVVIDQFVYALAPDIVDDRDLAISYNGIWTHFSDALDYNATEKYSNGVNSYAEFSFYGTAIKWIGPKNNNLGISDVYIDGVLDQAGIDAYAPAKTHQQALYSKTGLSSGVKHTIKVVVTGSKNASSSNTYLAIDAFDTSTQANPNAFVSNNTDWYDTSGKLISAHEAGMTQVGNTYYWFGTSYTDNPRGNYGNAGHNQLNGMNVYASNDLVNWKYAGVALDVPATGVGTVGTNHRPHVIFNESTGKYVMWFFEIRDRYPDAMLHVATSDTPVGPYIIQQATIATAAPGGYAQDFDLFKDTDGSAYLIYDDGTRSIRVDKLSSDYLNTTSSSVMAIPNTVHSSEAPAMIKYNGKYLVTASGVLGWGGTPTWGALADTPLGTYSTAKQLTSGMGSWIQNTDLVYVSNSNTVFQIGDSWKNPNSSDIDKSRYFFMPVSINAQNNTASITYYSQYNPLTGWHN